MKYAILFLLITTSALAQQTSFRGRVIDEKTKEALPFVNLFISNTTKGTSSNEAGEFTFKNLPVGSYNVVASLVGYFSKSSPITIKEENAVVVIEISLLPNQQLLNEVTVKSSRDKTWEANLKRFKDVFLGISPNAQKCKILNPYVIDFEKKEDQLFAKSSQPILIENLALGYKLTFLMKQFKVSKTDFLIAGDTFYEEMLASPQEIIIWKEKRLDAYLGSTKHFLQSLAQHTSSQDGFNIYGYSDINSDKISSSFIRNLTTEKSVRKLNPDSLITKNGSLTYLDLSKNIEIHYTPKIEYKGPYVDINHQVSRIESKLNVVGYNQYGLFDTVSDIFMVGSFSNLRVADWLPIDFQPRIEDLIAKIPASTNENDYGHLQEKIVFHTNKSNYYLGETLWFKTYLTYTKQAFVDAISKVVYVDLIDQEQNIVETKVLKVKNGVSHGDFVLNPNLKNSSYFLRAYTNWMRNFGDSTQAIHEIVVLGKNQKNESQIAEIQYNSEKISLNKDNFNTSENVEITLTGVPNHSFSISVTNKDAVKTYIPIQQSDFIKQAINLETINYISETGRTFLGKTKDENGNPIAAELLLMRKDTFLLDSYQSNKKGEFKIENIVGTDTLVIDILANNKKGKPIFNIVLEEPPKPQFYLPKQRINIKITDSQLVTPNVSFADTYDFDISNSIVLQEVGIKAKKPDTTMLMRFHKIFGKPTYEFSDKKINFNGKLNFIQAIQNRIAGLNITFDALTGNMSMVWNRGGAPEVWVDGIKVNSINETRFVTADMIDRIEVYRQNMSMVFPTGLISIFTKSFISGSDLEVAQTPPAKGIKRFKMLGFYSPKNFYLPKNELDTAKLYQLKNRSTIYWNPDVFTNDEGRAKVSFQAIGKPGKYRIEIVGYDMNGKIIKVEKGFTID